MDKANLSQAVFYKTITPPSECNCMDYLLCINPLHTPVPLGRGFIAILAVSASHTRVWPGQEKSGHTRLLLRLKA